MTPRQVPIDSETKTLKAELKESRTEIERLRIELLEWIELAHAWRNRAEVFQNGFSQVQYNQQVAMNAQNRFQPGQLGQQGVYCTCVPGRYGFLRGENSMTTTAAAYATNLKTFKGEVAFAIAAAKNYGRTKMTADIAPMVASLATDTTTHDKTMQSAPQPLRVGNDKSPFTNKVALAINKGKAANLTASDMHDALNTALAAVVKPINTAVPSVQGTGVVGQILTCTTGIWAAQPASYTYAWQRAGVAIGGATSSSYTLVALDSTKAIGCIVTATNTAGSTAAPISNTILCA